MGILSRIKNKFKPSLDEQSTRFTSLAGFTIMDPNWQLTDCNGAYWKYNASTKRIHPLGDYKPSARGTWYVDLNVAQNRLHATVLLKRTIDTKTYPDLKLDTYVCDAVCRITGASIICSTDTLFETLLKVAESRGGYLFASED